MTENDKRHNRNSKIAAITLITASIAFVASSYLLEDETDIFEGVTSLKEAHKIWLEYNRNNHPDKCNLKSEHLEKHMCDYYNVKKRYEELKENLY